TDAPVTGAVSVMVGGLLSTTIVTEAEVVVLPAASRATAVSVWLPFAAVVVVHTRLYGLVVTSDPSGAPSSLNCTPATATLSAADAVRVTAPNSIAPVAGAVSVTVGAVESTTVKGMPGAVAVLPAASRATAVTVWLPTASVESHLTV